jgi:hypothetical protein
MPQSPMTVFCWWFTNGTTNEIYPSVYFREFEKHYCIYHYHWWKYTDGIFPSAYFQWELFFLDAHCPSVKSSVFFPTELATDGGITDERYTDEMLIARQKKNFLNKTIKCCSVLKPYLHGKTSWRPKSIFFFVKKIKLRWLCFDKKNDKVIFFSRLTWVETSFKIVQNDIRTFNIKPYLAIKIHDDPSQFNL